MKHADIQKLHDAGLITPDIPAAFFSLFDSRTRTGVMFLISGIFLIVFGVYLEMKRRRLMKQIQLQTSEPAAPPPVSVL